MRRLCEMLEREFTSMEGGKVGIPFSDSYFNSISHEMPEKDFGHGFVEPANSRNTSYNSDWSAQTTSESTKKISFQENLQSSRIRTGMPPRRVCTAAQRTGQ
uniref:Uncharacterized protein n=1 Tax=Homalodisca liturata TaxID=320908 RepID=A0A1B6H9W8_9HEMI